MRPKLVEGIDEFTSAPDGNDVAILAVGDWKAERERAVGGVALALPKRRVGKDFALAVLDGDGSVTAYVGVSARAAAQCPVRFDRIQSGAVDEDENPWHRSCLEDPKALGELRAERVDRELVGFQTLLR